MIRGCCGTTENQAVRTKQIWRKGNVSLHAPRGSTANKIFEIAKINGERYVRGEREAGLELASSLKRLRWLWWHRCI